MDISHLLQPTPKSRPPPNDDSPTSTNDTPTTSTPAVDQATLFHAIDSANLNRVQAVLREICASNPAAFKSACDKLLIVKDADGGGRDGGKRKQLRFEICVQCEDEYNVGDNLDGDCVWHSGETEPDMEGDFWADHDENCHGKIDSEWARNEYPEGFVWSCCEQNGDADGCESGVHVPDLGKRAKVRV